MRIKLFTYFFLFVHLIIFFDSSTNAQVLPNYGERSILVTEPKAEIPSQKDDLKTILLSQSIPNPDEYIVGTGDRFYISIRGIEDENLNIFVNPEGSVFIPKVGTIYLTGLTLNAAKEKLNDVVLSNFKNITIDISLMEVKTIQVNLIGDVYKAASYSLPATARLNDLVMNSKGLNNTADLRNISIISSDTKADYDLLRFLRVGDKSNNPYLQNGDIVKINKTDKLVSIFGAVPNPGTYEFVQGESVLEFISLAGGFKDNAKTDTVEIISFHDDNKTLFSRFYTLDQLAEGNVKLKRGDKVVVREKPEYLIDRIVTITGFVKFPGVYKIEQEKSFLRDLILNQAGGFLDDASIKDSHLTRYDKTTDQEDPEFERLKQIPIPDMTEEEYDYFKAKSREKRGRMIVDFEKLFIQGDLSEDVILQKNDRIHVPEAKNYITIVGQVVNPGNIIFKKNFSVTDYIESAGGFAWRAVDNDVRVVKANSGEWIEADDIELLEPGDIIWVPEEPPAPEFWDVFIDALTVTGQVATVIAAVVAVVIATRN